MAEYIERRRLFNALADYWKIPHDWDGGIAQPCENALAFIENAPEEDVAPVRHGRWILEAHDEGVNYRWNVTAECSECCNGQEEIWAGLFPNVPDCIARGAALVSAESVKLSNYCPNCGAKMDLEGGGGA